MYRKLAKTLQRIPICPSPNATIVNTSDAADLLYLLLLFSR